MGTRRKITNQKLISIAAVTVLLILAWKGFGLWRERQKVNHEIALLTQQKQELQGKNDQIEQSLKYLNTNSYKDQLARQQDLQHPGEVVINLPNNVDVADESDNKTSNVGNFLLWWKYFFDKNN